MTTLSEKLAAAENDAATWKADAGATHLKLVAAEAKLTRLTEALELIEDKARFGQRGQFKAIIQVVQAALSPPAGDEP